MKNLAKKTLQGIIQKSVTWADVVRALGLRVHGGNYRTVQIKAGKWGISSAHFTGRSPNPIKPKMSMAEILVRGSQYKGNLKERLVKAGLLKEKCYNEACPTHQISSWGGKDFRLQLDHVNGDKYDNRLENLRMLCAICHAHTDTYGSRNRQRKIKEQKYCADCRKPTKGYGKRCISCAKRKQPTKIKWPESSVLLRMVADSNYVAVSKVLGVTDNALRKRLKNHPPKSYSEIDITSVS